MLVKSFAHLMLWIFWDPPEKGGLTLNMVEYETLKCPPCKSLPISSRVGRKKILFKCAKLLTKTVGRTRVKMEISKAYDNDKITLYEISLFWIGTNFILWHYSSIFDNSLWQIAKERYCGQLHLAHWRRCFS